MKKLFVLLCAALMMFTCPFAIGAESAGESLPQKEIGKVLKTFKRKKGFQMSSMGSFEIGVIKSVGKSVKEMKDEDLDDDTREMLRMMSVFENLKSVKALDFEEASAEDKQAFVAAISEVLKDVPVSEDIDKDGIVTYVYGYRISDGESYDGLVALSEDEGSFMYIEGILNLEKLRIIMEEE